MLLLVVVAAVLAVLESDPSLEPMPDVDPSAPLILILFKMVCESLAMTMP